MAFNKPLVIASTRQVCIAVQAPLALLLLCLGYALAQHGTSLH